MLLKPYPEIALSHVLTPPDEDMDMDTDQIASGINSHGKVLIEITRGTRIPKKWKWAHTRPRTVPGHQDTHTSSKAVVKDNHVSHAIKYAAKSYTVY